MRMYGLKSATTAIYKSNTANLVDRGITAVWQDVFPNSDNGIEWQVSGGENKDVTALNI